MNFLFSKRKGGMRGMGGGHGSGAGGGACILGVIVLIICIWPFIKGHLNFNFDFSDSPLGHWSSSSSESASENDASSDITVVDNGDGTQTVITEDFSFDMAEAQRLASEVRIGEADSNNDSARGDWETSGKFTCPVSGVKSGMKNYAYELETGLAYNREDFSYICPYTHEEVTNVRNIDYDHIIPINYVDLHGGCNWSAEQKQEYAYNPENGICTWNSPNRAKSDKGPSEYMPEYNQEWYCYKWLEIAVRYDLPISQADYDVIVQTLGIGG